MALSNPNWRRKDDDSSSSSSSSSSSLSGSASFFSQDEIGSSLMVNQPNSPISSASNTPIQLSPEKHPLDGDNATPLSFSPKPRPTFHARSRTGSFSGRESKEETSLSQLQLQQQQQGVTMLGGAPIPPGFIPNMKRRSEVIPSGRLMPKTGPNSAAAMAAQQQQQQQQQQQVQEEKTKNNSPWADIKVLNATTIAQAIHNDGSKSRVGSFSRGSSQPPIGTHQQTQAIVNHVPMTQGNDKQPLLLLRSKSRDDSAGAGSGSGAGLLPGAPAPAGTTRMTPLTPKSVKRTPVQRLVPNTTNPDSPLTFIPENNIIRFNKLMLEDVTLESMKAAGNTAAASTSTSTSTTTTSNPGSGSGGNTPRQTPTSLSSSTIAAILAQQAAVQKDAQAVNAVYADEELIRKRAESLQYDLHRLQEKKLRSNLRSEEHRLRQETNLDVEHKEAQLLNHLNQSLIQCAEQKDSKVFQCVQFQQELQEKINTLQKMFDKMTNRIGVLEAEFVTCVSSLREEYSSIMTEYYHDPPIVEQKLSSIPHFAEVEQLKTTLAAQGVQVVAGRPNMTMTITVAEMDGRQANAPIDPLTQSRRTSIMMYPHNPANGPASGPAPAPGSRPGSAAPTLAGRQVSAAPVLQPSSRVSPVASPPNGSPPSHVRAIQASAQQQQHQAHVAAQAQAQSQAQQFGAAPILRRSSTFSGGVSASILPAGAKRPSISLHPSLMPAAPVRPAASPTSTAQQATATATFSPTAAGAGAGTGSGVAASAGVPPRSPTAATATATATAPGAPTASSPSLSLSPPRHFEAHELEHGQVQSTTSTTSTAAATDAAPAETTAAASS